MTNRDPANADLFNDFLDRMVNDMAADPIGLDPALADAARRLQTRARDVAPDPAFVNRLGATLLREPALASRHDGVVRMLPAGSPEPIRVPPRGATPHPHPPRDRVWWPLAESVAVAALLLVLLGGLFNVARLRPAALIGSRAPAANYALYVGSNPNTVSPAQRQLTPLDPQTLADRPELPPISLAAPDAVWMVGAGNDPSQTYALSADGSTLVDLEPEATMATAPAGTAATPGAVQTADQTMVAIVRDGRTGAIRRRIHPPAAVAYPVLSADGARLVLRQIGAGFYVYDTSSGQLLTTLQTDPQNWWEGVTDASARDLYLLATSGAPLTGAVPGPWPTQLLAYDLTTGQIVGRLPLPDVLAGTWLLQGGPYDALFPTSVTPALALSPDGRQLAIVAADTGAVTLVDTATLTVARTFTPARSSGLAGRLLGYAGLVPRPAAAKARPATERHAIFSPDGHSLYLFGETDQLDLAHGTMAAHSLGLQRIALESGAIAASGLPDTLLDRALPAPDGRTLYVFGPTRSPFGAGPLGPPYRLQRLDAATLAVDATRTFDSNRWLVVRSGGT